MSSVVWDIVQRTLIDAGIDTYAPSQHQGDCTDFYAVLKYDGSSQKGNYSSEQPYYTLLCYAPRNKYIELLDFVQKCEDVMAKSPIYPMLKPTGIKTPSYFDDTVNGYMISVQYRNMKRNEHL